MRTRHVRAASLSLLICWAMIVASPGAKGRSQPASAPKLDRKLAHLAETSPGEWVRAIVTARGSARDGVKQQLRTRGHQILDEHPLVNAVTVNVPAGELASLAQRDDVDHVSIDAPVRGVLDNVGTLSTNMLLPTLGLPNAINGKDVGVAILDSGIVDHDQLPVAAFYDFTRGGVVKMKEYDDFGHGTHVAGTVRNKDDKSDARYRSVAKGARLIGMKVLAADGSGYTSTVIRAMEFAITNKSALKIDVINLSLGHPIYESATTDPMVLAVEKAVASGIVVVVAAGNEGMNRDTGEIGYAGITSPGNAPSAITVGAVDSKNTETRSDDEVAPYSSRGPTWYDGYAKPDVVAPGRHIVSFMAKNSRLYRDYPQWRVDVATRSYMSLSGTSMAAAVTTGVVAEIIQAVRDANGGQVPTPNTVKAILEYTAVPLAGVDPLTQGAGSINAAGAIALGRLVNLNRAAGTVWLDSTPDPYTTLTNGEVVNWSERLVWGDRIVWGTYIYTNEPAWALRIVWGDQAVWGDRIVWGTADDSVVWGDRIVWGTRIVWGASVVGYSAEGGVLYGDDINWHNVTADRIVWGTLSSGLGALSEDTITGAGWTPVF